MMKKQQTRVIVVGIISAWAITACSSKQNNLPKCDSSAVKSQLLQIASNNVPPNQFIQPAIIKIEEQRAVNHDALLSCKAQIAYQHKIYPPQTQIQDYSYQVNSEYQITQLQTEQKAAAKFKNWLASIPTVVSQQPTSDGVLAIIQTRKTNSNGDLIQLLVKDEQIIKLNNKADYSSITIDKRFILGNNEVYLVSAYYNDAREQTIAHSFFLNIESTAIKTSAPFMYLPGSIQIKKPDSLVLTDFTNIRFPKRMINQYTNMTITK